MPTPSREAINDCLNDFFARTPVQRRAPTIVQIWRSSLWDRLIDRADEHLRRWEDDGGGPR